MSDTYTIPIFPLDLVLYPNEQLPLHIFEDRYRKMISDCLNEEAPFGIVLMNEGKLAEVESLLVEVLGTSRATLGDRHTLTVKSINSLASFWLAQGKLAEAEPLFVEALGASRATLGDLHPDTLTYMNNVLTNIVSC